MSSDQQLTHRRRNKKKKRAQFEALARNEWEEEGAVMYDHDSEIQELIQNTAPEEDQDQDRGPGPSPSASTAASTASSGRQNTSTPSESEDDELQDATIEQDQQKTTFRIIFFILLLILAAVGTVVLVENYNNEGAISVGGGGNDHYSQNLEPHLHEPSLKNEDELVDDNPGFDERLFKESIYNVESPNANEQEYKSDSHVVDDIDDFGDGDQPEGDSEYNGNDAEDQGILGVIQESLGSLVYGVWETMWESGMEYLSPDEKPDNVDDEGQTSPDEEDDESHEDVTNTNDKEPVIMDEDLSFQARVEEEIQVEEPILVAQAGHDLHETPGTFDEGDSNNVGNGFGDDREPEKQEAPLLNEGFWGIEQQQVPDPVTQQDDYVQEVDSDNDGFEPESNSDDTDQAVPESDIDQSYWSYYSEDQSKPTETRGDQDPVSNEQRWTAAQEPIVEEPTIEEKAEQDSDGKAESVTEETATGIPEADDPQSQYQSNSNGYWENVPEPSETASVRTEDNERTTTGVPEPKQSSASQSSERDQNDNNGRNDENYYRYNSNY